MMSFKYGDIVLVEFTFSEFNVTKKRPALVISSNHFQQNRQEILIAAITSNIKRVLYGDTIIKSWKEAGLKFPSLVAGVIQTVKHDMVYRKLGILSKNDIKHVESNLKKIVGF